MASIQTIRQKTINAFQVRWGRQKAKETAFFSVGRYGSEAMALKAAKALLEKLPSPVQRDNIQPYASNTSGVKGIRMRWDATKSGWAYPYIVCSYVNKDGENKGVAYSVDKHGLEGALKMAIKVRTENGFKMPSLKKCVSIFEQQL